MGRVRKHSCSPRAGKNACPTYLREEQARHRDRRGLYGSDCVGTALAEGALSVTQLEILPQPPEGHNPDTPWPFWPKIMRTLSSQEEGCQRRWSTLTKALTGTGGRVTELHACTVAWVPGPKGWQMQEIPGTEFTLPADLVLIAMGFVHVAHAGLVADLGIHLDGHGNVVVSRWMSSVPGVFAAGDTVLGRIAGGSRHQPGPALRGRVRPMVAERA